MKATPVKKFKLKKGDTVKIIAGKYKGTIGKLAKLLKKTNKAIVENANLVKKHVKPNPQKGIDGGISELEAPIHYSNVALYNDATKKTDRVAYKQDEKTGKKIRVYNSTKEPLE